MAHWQLDPSGRFPQACFDHVKAQAPASVEDAYLFACAWLIANGFYYENSDFHRLIGDRGYVDCSGMVVLATNCARAVMGLPSVEVPQNSGYMAQACHKAARPQWVTDRYGPGQGYGITADQANNTPASLAFHGRDEGQLGFGDGGHVKSKYFIHRDGDPNAGANVSIEAMSHALDLRYSNFLDHEDSYFAVSPWLGDYATITHQLEHSMQIFMCPNKPAKDTLRPHAEFWPAGSTPLFPNGALLMKAGASIVKDQPTKDPNTRILLPGAGRKWIGCGTELDGKGLVVLNDQGNTSGPGSLAWS